MLASNLDIARALSLGLRRDITSTITRKIFGFNTQLGMKRPLVQYNLEDRVHRGKHLHVTTSSNMNDQTLSNETKTSASEVLPNTRKPLVIVLAGPTGVGKSDVAAILCKPGNSRRIFKSAFPTISDQFTSVGHIISADSVQAYEGVNVGANKPTEEERRQTKYHLVDVVPATAGTPPYSAATWRKDALTLLDHLSQPTRQALQHNIATESLVMPVVVGGTMMYLQWLVHGKPNAPKPSEQIIAKAMATIQSYQSENQWSEAKGFVSNFGEVFRQRVAQLGDNDWYRLRRVYEIALSTESSNISHDDLFNEERQGGLAQSEEYDLRCFFLCPTERMDHTAVVDLRCEQMLQNGLLRETQQLYTNGQLPLDSQPARAIGYRQALEYLMRSNPQNNDVESFQKFVDDFCTATRQYAKKQMQWFRRDAQFTFVPVVTTQSKDLRNQATAKIIADMCSLSRDDYDRDLFSDTSLSANTKRANEAQGKQMKFYRGKRCILIDASDNLRQILTEADECTAIIQGLQESS